MNPERKNKPSAILTRIVTPGECTAEDFQAFAQLVRQGEQVAARGLEARIAAAAWLGFAWIGGTLAGVAALKVPRPTYHKKVFAAAAVAPHAGHFPLEFGWVFVIPPFRGLGVAKKLLDEMLAKNSGAGIFATTSKDNHFMQEILRGAGFEIVGKAFPSDRTSSNNLLWVKQDKGQALTPRLSKAMTTVQD